MTTTDDAPRPAHGQWPGWMTTDWSEFPSTDHHDLEVWGYTDRLSYLPGDRVDLHVCTTAETWSLRIWRDGGQEQQVLHAQDLPGAWHPTPRDVSSNGCGWPVAHSFTIPANWASGAYVLELEVSRDGELRRQEAFMVVRAAPGGERSGRVALVLATSTWIAYNNWGGGSSYTNPDAADFTDLDAARTQGFVPVLSTQRPWARGLIRLPAAAPRIPLRQPPPMGWAVHYPGQEWPMANGYAVTCTAAGWAAYDSHMARWLERQGYAVDYLTQHDLHFDPACLDGYRCVMTCGHDEYWSHPARQTLDRFIDAGGRLARFGGNIFWQVRLEDEGRTQTCYKYIADSHDPLRNDPDQQDLFTAAFEAGSLNRPGVTTFGANGAQGVYARLGGSMPRSSGGFTVYRNSHWAFAGTDLYYGDVFGGEVPLVGYECDGVDYGFRHGLPYPTGDDGAPAELQILAMTPATMEEEDHGHPGQVLQHGDGDLRIICEAIHGDTSDEHLAMTRYGCAVITSMPKGRGEVFCAGTTEWPWALTCAEPFCATITRNVLDRFLSP